MVRKKHLGISGQHFQRKNILKEDSKSSLDKIMKFRTKRGEGIRTDGPDKAKIIKTQVTGKHNWEARKRKHGVCSIYGRSVLNEQRGELHPLKMLYFHPRRDVRSMMR